MKLQISFDMIDLDQAIKIATQVEKYADIIEVGTPLIYKEGINAVKTFRSKFPNKEIFADIKIVDRIEDVIQLYIQAGTSYFSVLAGTSNATIQEASKVAHSAKTKMALDLIDAYSMGQSAMDAKALDIDTIIFHGPHETTQLLDLLEEWQNVRGNTTLPIFVSGNINRNNISKILSLKPQGLIIGSAITKADNPEKEAEYFKSLF